MTIKRFGAALIAALAIVFLPPATFAVPAPCVMPTSGTVSGLTLVQDINTCNTSMIGLFSGGSAPSSPTAGMLWWNTGTNIVSEYDANGNWDPIWFVDATDGLVALQIGGGIQATITSAATVDLWSTPVSSIAVTGATTITALTNADAAPGTLKVVAFQGVLTLTNNSTSLILPNGGSNITTAAGDYALVLALTKTNVAVVYYQRATGAALSSQGLNVGASALGNSALGINQPVNLGLTASVGSSALTVSITGVNGAAPSSVNPVLIPFRSSTLATGTPVIDSLQSSLSITIASGNTMGCTSGVACRIWIYAIDNTGTPAIGVMTCSNTTQIFACSDDLVFNTASGTSGGSSGGTLYASTGSLAGKAVRIIGYLEATEATAGTWATAPSKIQLFGPGMKKPGDIVQGPIYATSNNGSTGSGTSNTTTLPTLSITPTSPINLIRIAARGILGTASSSATITAQIFRAVGGSPACTTGIGSLLYAPSTSPSTATITIGGIDAPQSVSQQTYTVCIKANSGAVNGTYCQQSLTAVCDLEGYEIMGRREDEPVNDNIHPGVLSRVS